MINNKKRVVALGLIIATMFSGCGISKNTETIEDTEYESGAAVNTEETDAEYGAVINTEEIETEYGEIYSTEDTESTNTSLITILPGETNDTYGTNTGREPVYIYPGVGLINYPYYYQNDYADLTMGSSSYASAGSLAVLLSEVLACEKDILYSPYDFIEDYKDCIDSNGLKNKEEIILDVLSNETHEFEKIDFNLVNMNHVFEQTYEPILIEINHPSIYGSTSTYLLILSDNYDGTVVVRDGNYDNVIKYSIEKDNKETNYSIVDLVIAAGSSSYMYAPKGGDYIEYNSKFKEELDNLNYNYISNPDIFSDYSSDLPYKFYMEVGDYLSMYFATQGFSNRQINISDLNGSAEKCSFTATIPNEDIQIYVTYDLYEYEFSASEKNE